MAIDIHTLTVIDSGANIARGDRVLAGFFPSLAYPAGGGAGQSVQITVPVKGLPAKYGVQVTCDQDAVAFVTKTATGFTITLSPRLAANTLAAGAVDAVLFA